MSNKIWRNFHKSRTSSKNVMKVLKFLNGGKGGGHFGSSYHVINIQISNKCENCFFYCKAWNHVV